MATLLRRKNIELEICADLPSLALACERGVGAILLSDLVFRDHALETLLVSLGLQPSWSDIPVVLLCRTTARGDDLRHFLRSLDNVTVLERPTTMRTLVSSVQAALRARSRQYQLRDQLEALRASEAALRARERQLETLTENTPDILSRFDRQLRHTFVNRAATDLTGIAREAFIGRTNRELGMPDELVVLWEACLRRVFETGESVQLQFEYPKDGEGAYFDNTLVPETDEGGEIRSVLCVAHNHTRTHRAELALQAANRRKDEFLAMLAHELRNPLAPIRNASEILVKMLPEDERVQKVLQIVRRQVGQMTRLVDDLLDVSRITEGRIELHCESLSLAQVVAQAIESVEPLIEEKGHAVIVSAAYDPIFVNGDMARLVQSLANVIANAAKYTDPGGEIHVETRMVGERALIAVSDNGIGIAADMLTSIFDLFVQGRRTIDRSQGGLGIGLAVVERLVQMHGGGVRAQSAGHGRGARFEIDLPVVPAPHVAGETPLPARTSARRILVVDDNHDAADMLADLLRISGHETLAVYSAPEALERVQTFSPEVVLLDIGLPVIDGYELAGRLRRARGSLRIVAVTGYGQEADVRRARAAGFDEHLVKPVDLARLSGVIG
ncbi:MAG: response regulator [Gammaproteobacteria bacterium]|nr:response regulator [Gammaproteobacteria bacterium]